MVTSVLLILACCAVMIAPCKLFRFSGLPDAPVWYFLSRGAGSYSTPRRSPLYLKKQELRAAATNYVRLYVTKYQEINSFLYSGNYSGYIQVAITKVE